MGKTVIMFPGQGAQKIGMSQEFYKKYKVGVKETIKFYYNFFHIKIRK